MATDKSEPRVGVIVQVAVIAVITLALVRMSLAAYFDRMSRAEEYRKVGDAVPSALLSVRADEKARLSSGPVPIDRAMHEIALRGRMTASPDIVPTASKDLAPLQGWTQLPQTPPGAITARHDEPTTNGASDAGLSGPDAGPKRPKPKPTESVPRETRPPPKSP